MSNKNLGQIFTPPNIAKYMLDLSKYSGKNILTMKVIEPSFGNGVFLIEICERIIEEASRQSLSKDEIQRILEDNIFGFEIDSGLYENTIKSLKELCASKEIQFTPKNLYLGDALELHKKYLNRFDFVIGNPPYVKSKDSYSRDSFKNFKYSNGNTDLYVVFFEIGINLLKENGRLCFITPNTFLKNSSQKKFRNYLFQTQYLQSVYDFGKDRVFSADTYTCITQISKTPHNDVEYVRLDKKLNILEDRKLSWSWFLGKDKWCFSEVLFETELCKVGNLATVSYAICTLADSTFAREFSDIESGILKPCVKASTYKGVSQGISIIYPYKKDGRPITLEEIEKQFPKAYEYLMSNRDSLMKRNFDSQWYLFGRSQGLSSTELHKLSIGHIIKMDSEYPEIHYVKPGTAVYSGLVISSLDKNIILQIQKELRTNEFQKYCIFNGKNLSNGFIQINADTVRKYPVRIKRTSQSLLDLL